ncbi:glucose/ribitol dehydrogenase [Artemisia annua]|uniref:Glucose/ribitol dehydrogenase n=1 Tax=Artemisia annua TaxID=35608 RepID=A0A2U1L0N8_ARTAN|nr:glucose/ribitol dehydrogenase [Artemisia annua]
MNSLISKRLEGKVAIITGGASGFGENTVRLFAKHGANVLIADVQDDRGNSICADFVSTPSEVIYVRCDVTKEADVKNVLDTAVSMFGKVDIVFSNAGIPGNPDFSILDFDSENVKRILDVNVFGVLFKE